MRFAFIILGPFDPQDRAEIHNGVAQIVGVANIDEAIEWAQELAAAGIDCIELCGAFGEDNARRIAGATGNSVPICYSINLPEHKNLLLEKGLSAH